MNVAGTCVTDNDVAQTVLQPRLDVEAVLLHAGGDCTRDRMILVRLHDEYRHLMFSQIEEQMSAGIVADVLDFSTDEFEGRVIQLGKIEREGELTLEPGFYGVSIGRYDINGIGACESRDMEVHQVRDCLLPR